MDTDKSIPLQTDIEDSNPNAAGPQGLRGDLGVSSERTGPDGRTDGAMNTYADEGGDPPTQEPATGPEMDDTQQEAAQGWRDKKSEAAPDAEDDNASIDRTVGEDNTAEVPAHDFDPSKNPGHSHG